MALSSVISCQDTTFPIFLGISFTGLDCFFATLNKMLILLDVETLSVHFRSVGLQTPFDTSQKSSHETGLKLGGQKPAESLTGGVLTKILWDFCVVCLNAP
jgi:hypothetical protein